MNMNINININININTNTIAIVINTFAMYHKKGKIVKLTVKRRILVPKK